jgi:hypothetical protein
VFLEEAWVRIVLQYFEGCPNTLLAENRLREALREVGMEDAEVLRERVDTPERAQAIRWRGSPSILLDGEDPFGDKASPVGFACRVYQTEEGPAGAPSVLQLVRALEGRSTDR